MSTSPIGRRRSRFALLLTAALLLGACGGGDDMNVSEPLPPDEAPAGASEARPVGLDGLTREVEAAIADAALRFDVAPERIAVAQAFEVTWADGSLGCPREGMMYTQQLVPGYRLVLEVEGRRIAYHGAQGMLPEPCLDEDPSGS